MHFTEGYEKGNSMLSVAWRHVPSRPGSVWSQSQKGLAIWQCLKIGYIADWNMKPQCDLAPRLSKIHLGHFESGYIWHHANVYVLLF
jgi:hypothetical protein